MPSIREMDLAGRWFAGRASTGLTLGEAREILSKAKKTRPSGGMADAQDLKSCVR